MIVETSKQDVLARLETLRKNRNISPYDRRLAMGFMPDERELLGSYPVACPVCGATASLRRCELILMQNLRCRELRAPCGHRFKARIDIELEAILISDYAATPENFIAVYRDEGGTLSRVR